MRDSVTPTGDVSTTADGKPPPFAQIYETEPSSEGTTDVDRRRVAPTWPMGRGLTFGARSPLDYVVVRSRKEKKGPSN